MTTTTQTPKSAAEQGSGADLGLTSRTRPDFFAAEHAQAGDDKPEQALSGGAVSPVPPTAPPAVANCGTYAGLQRHQREGTKPCAQCREAAAQYKRDYCAGLAGRNGLAYAERNRLRGRAVTAAFARLKAAHRDEWARLLDEEKAKRGIA